MLLAADYPIEPFEDATPLLGDSSKIHERAAELGYLYFANLLPKELLAPVRAFVREECARYGWVRRDKRNPRSMRARTRAKLTGRGWDDPNWTKFQLAFCNNADFLTLASHELILSTLEAVAGEPMAPAISHHCWLKLPGSPEHTTGPHQDIFYLPTCPRMWTVWVPLVDTPMDVGPLAIIPRSHRRKWHHVDAMTGIQVSHDEGWATAPVSPGAIVMFDAATVHCAWSNVSPKLVRLSLDVRYEPRNLPGPSILRPNR